jgi:two-component system sensor histidine kinase/response regulator
MLKIIALTANITEEQVDYYKEIGMDRHLGKLSKLDKITEVLADYFE